ncbi:38326_t:CDS:2, partial [Gigaspora margarita]
MNEVPTLIVLKRKRADVYTENICIACESEKESLEHIMGYKNQSESYNLWNQRTSKGKGVKIIVQENIAKKLGDSKDKEEKSQSLLADA